MERNKMDKNVDYLIIGGGPSGLSLASELKGRTLILEKENDTFFKYQPKKEKKTFDKKTQKESPFGVLKKLSFN